MSAQTTKPRLLPRLRQATMTWGDSVYIRLYRLLRGRWVDRFTAGAPVILLTTNGRRTGLSRTVALGHLVAGEDVMVAGTNGGLGPVPGWVWNLRNDPRCLVEAGGDRFDATAEFLDGERYETHWHQLTNTHPIYEKARDMLERPVPVVLLHRVET